MVTRHVSAADLKAMLGDGGELALIDLREELPFSERHLLWARSLPLGRLELRLAALVPRRTTRIVLCDAGEGLAERGAAKLAALGYGDVALLEGGIDGWERAGFVLFSGVNVPSKAFGEFIEHARGTPSIAAEELHRLREAGRDLVVVDSRPYDEYHRVSIPGGIDMPGAELVFRIRDAAPDPATLVVVNCAGRTRSIIGAQSLINADLPNQVVALRNGTMGWTLAGFEPDHGKERRAPRPSAPALAWAKAAAASVAAKVGVTTIDAAQLARWRDDRTRTTYLLDVRDPDEYAAGHLPGAVSAPGGQLVQATDQYVGTLAARLVLADPDEVRAAMTASWLKQMGWNDVFVITASGTDIGKPKPDVLGYEERPAFGLDPASLVELLARGHATVLDLSTSRAFHDAHIEGAWFAIRSRLGHAMARVPRTEFLVLTSEDGVLACLAVPEADALAPGRVRYLEGGNAGWASAGYLLQSGAGNLADEPLDLWLKPYDRARDTRKAMEDYLAWEVDLLPRIERDGTCRFRAPA